MLFFRVEIRGIFIFLFVFSFYRRFLPLGVFLYAFGKKSGGFRSESVCLRRLPYLGATERKKERKCFGKQASSFFSFAHVVF